MRSRTSRGVPEWSGGKDLYIGRSVTATGKVLGVTGIVPGPPEGSQGSTGWGHLSRRAPWAEVGREPALSGLGRPPWASPLRLGLETLGWGGAPLALGGKSPPRPPPPSRWVLAGAPLPGVLYKGGMEGSNTPALGASLLPCNTSLSRAEARRSPAGEPLHPPPRRRAVGSPSTSPPPCWIKKGGDVAAPYVC